MSSPTCKTYGRLSREKKTVTKRKVRFERRDRVISTVRVGNQPMAPDIEKGSEGFVLAVVYRGDKGKPDKLCVQFSGYSGADNVFSDWLKKMPVKRKKHAKV